MELLKKLKRSGYLGETQQMIQEMDDRKSGDLPTYLPTSNIMPTQVDHDEHDENATNSVQEHSKMLRKYRGD